MEGNDRADIYLPVIKQEFKNDIRGMEGLEPRW
jgi:hypothetical protein